MERKQLIRSIDDQSICVKCREQKQSESMIYAVAWSLITTSHVHTRTYIITPHTTSEFDFLTATHRLMSFFFFQAEDGIRDIGVTGVQTCALPISSAIAASMLLPRTPSRV